MTTCECKPEHEQKNDTQSGMVSHARRLTHWDDAGRRFGAVPGEQSHRQANNRAEYNAEYNAVVVACRIRTAASEQTDTQ